MHTHVYIYGEYISSILLSEQEKINTTSRLHAITRVYMRPAALISWTYLLENAKVFLLLHRIGKTRCGCGWCVFFPL